MSAACQIAKAVKQAVFHDSYTSIRRIFSIATSPPSSFRTCLAAANGEWGLAKLASASRLTQAFWRKLALGFRGPAAKTFADVLCRRSAHHGQHLFEKCPPVLAVAEWRRWRLTRRCNTHVRAANTTVWVRRPRGMAACAAACNASSAYVTTMILFSPQESESRVMHQPFDTRSRQRRLRGSRGT